MAFTSPFDQNNYLGSFIDDTACEAFLSSVSWPLVDGLFYYNSITNIIRFRIEGAWTNFALIDDPRLGDGTGTAGPILVTMSEANKTYKASSSTVYESVQDFIFPGTLAVGIPTVISAVVHKSGGIAMDLRIFDITNSLTIAELTGIVDETPVIRIIDSVTNLPAARSLWTVQIRRDGGGATARVSAVLIEF